MMQRRAHRQEFCVTRMKYKLTRDTRSSRSARCGQLCVEAFQRQTPPFSDHLCILLYFASDEGAEVRSHTPDKTHRKYAVSYEQVARQKAQLPSAIHFIAGKAGITRIAPPLRSQ